MLTLARLRPILLLLSGNLLGAAVGGAFFFAASWRFPLEEMGRYAVAISTQWVTFGLIGTGVSIATLRLVRDRLAASDRPGGAGIIVNAALGVVALALLVALVGWLALERFGVGVSIAPLLAVLAVLWAGARALLDVLRSGLLAQQDFRRTAVLTVLSAATGLTALVVTLLTGELTVRRMLIAHVVGLSCGVLASIPLLVPLAREGVRRTGGRHLFEYARWPALSEGTRLLQANLGPLLLAGVAGSAEAGLFGLGRYPAYLFEVVAVTLYQFWLARAVQIPDRASMRGYVGRQLRFASVLGVAMVAAALVAQPLLPLLGENFARAGSLFVLSAVDFALVLLIRPIETVFHGLRRPHLELLQRGVTLPVLVVAAVWLGGRFGAMGMAGAHVLASIFSLACGLLLLRRALTVAPAA